MISFKSLVVALLFLSFKLYQALLQITANFKRFLNF